MNCPRCNGTNVNVQLLTESQLVRKKQSCLYWLVFGWWFELLMWVFLTLPRLIILIFFPKKQKLISKEKKVAVCQNCGNSWEIK